MIAKWFEWVSLAAAVTAVMAALSLGFGDLETLVNFELPTDQSNPPIEMGSQVQGVVKSIETESRAIFETAKRLKREDILILEASEVLCVALDCEHVNETQASVIVQRAIAEADREAVQRTRLEALWIGRIGMLFTAASLIIAYLALRQSRQADLRSVRNEERISIMKSEDQT